MTCINVLSLDGGGIRGIIPASILVVIEHCIGRPLHEVFDLIAGTSTGGIIALGIGTTANSDQPYSPAELVGLYVTYGPIIFKKNLLTPLRQFFGPKYSPAALEGTLEKFFRDTQFRSALTPLLISSYDLVEQVPYFFKSHRIASNATYNWDVRHIARATSAAPTFFPPLRRTGDGRERALIDGGIFVNNPAMAAYSEARHLYPDAKEFLVLSVGTGDRKDDITYSQAKRWGLFGWARHIIPVMMDSVSEAVDYELDAVFSNDETKHHFRLQPDLNESMSPMDNIAPENLQQLKDKAEEFFREKSSAMEALWAELRRGRGRPDMPGIGLPGIRKAGARGDAHEL